MPHTVLERQTLCFSSNKNRNLKVKLWWIGACERKKSAFFVMLILSEGKTFNICFISMYNGWNFQNIYAFTYQKTLPHTLFCLFLKSLKAFSVSLTEWVVSKIKASKQLLENLKRNDMTVLIN